MKKLLALVMAAILVAVCLSACQNVPDPAAIAPAFIANIPAL